VNINKAIRELYEEKKRLDRVISSLEEMQRNGAVVVASPLQKRRGRKSMDEHARQEVSERMKRYWDERRKHDQAVEQSKA
jgi:RNase H-fold protein (predicted Holliday junction resolvase)